MENNNTIDIWDVLKNNYFFSDIIEKVSFENIKNSGINVYSDLEVRGKELHHGLQKSVTDLTKNNCPWWYYSVYLVPIIWTVSLYMRGYWLTTIPVFVFLVIPILEFILGNEGINPSDDEYDNLQEDKRYMWALWLWPIAQYYIICFGAFSINYMNLNNLEIFLLSISAGVINGGIGINVAHELIHRNNNKERTLGQVLLIGMLYPHFYIEHLLGHHKNVATELDPATSRKGENVYYFICRSIKHSYLSSWTLAEKYKRTHIMYLYHFFELIYFYIIFSFAGAISILFILLQSLVAVILLEIVNYIEHYGLERKQGQNVTIMHSWNTDKVFTNYLTFRLQRHSDHHQDSKRRYPNLRTFEKAPKLPTGYLGCVILALIPPLWKYIMHKKLSKLNIKTKKDY